jgi:ribosomal protein L35
MSDNNACWWPLNCPAGAAAVNTGTGWKSTTASAADRLRFTGKSDREHWAAGRSHVKTFKASVEKLAAKNHAPVVHYQKRFDEAFSVVRRNIESGMAFAQPTPANS